MHCSYMLNDSAHEHTSTIFYATTHIACIFLCSGECVCHVLFHFMETILIEALNLVKAYVDAIKDYISMKGSG